MKKDLLSEQIQKNNRTQNIFFIIKKIQIISLVWLLTLWSPATAMIKDKIEEDIINNLEDNNATNFEKDNINENQKYEQRLLQITNIEKFHPEIIGKVFDSIKYWEKKFDTLNIPENMRLPLQSVYLNPNNDINIITKFKDIHYLPNVDFAYQLSWIYHEKLQEYKENTPSIPIILWLLSYETGIRNVLWDDWKSNGYGQLYKPTAEYLLNESKYADIFSKYFYIDNEWILYFHGKTELEQQENMIRTIFDILVLVKWYKKGDELAALARYNWSQHNLDRYARQVIYKAINYTIFLSAMSQNTFWYEEGLKPIEHIIEEEGKKINKTIEIFKDVFNQQVQETYLWYKNPTLYAQSKNKTIEWNLLWFKYGEFSNVVFNQTVTGNPYIIPEKNKTIFSYFRENTWEALEYHNTIAMDTKNKIDLFYYELIDNKKIKKIITSKEEMNQKYKEWFMIYASQNKKKIYVDQQNNLYHYKGTEDRVTTIYIEQLKEIQQQQ